MKDRLIELIRNAPKFEFPSGSRAQGKTYQTSANLADYLIANGVVIIDPQKYPPVTGRDLIDTIMGVPLDEVAALIAERKLKELPEKKQTEDQIYNDLSTAGWNLFTDEQSKRQVARHLAMCGYSKQTELVRKIFTEIDKIIDKHHSDCNEYEDGDECDTAITYIAYISCDIDDLYQKYMEGADDEKQKMP